MSSKKLKTWCGVAIRQEESSTTSPVRLSNKARDDGREMIFLRANSSGTSKKGPDVGPGRYHCTIHRDIGVLIHNRESQPPPSQTLSLKKGKFCSTELR